ncbi:uncharacterized protein TNCV_1391611 [Trichonephila clavipes]|nr:uncharacterized protein TNCV_1391611 [Trichonephila clavipes]
MGERYLRRDVPSRHGGSLNSRRAASPLVWLVEGEEEWEASDHPQSILPLNWGGPSQIILSPVWCSKLRITTGVTLPFAMMNFGGIDLAFADQVALPDNPCSGGLANSVSDKKIEKVRKLITEARQLTMGIIADELQINSESVRQIATQILGMSKMRYRYF